MSYSFQLTITRNYDPTGTPAGHYLKIQCTAASGPNSFAETKIFVFQRDVLSGITATYDSWFDNVASVVDLQQSDGLSAEPDPTLADPPQFRLNYFEAYFLSRVELDQCVLDVQDDVRLLVKGLGLQDAASSPTVVTITE